MGSGDGIGDGLGVGEGEDRDPPEEDDPELVEDGSSRVVKTATGLQSLRISPSDFLYLGDSAVDMKTAKSAGMFACGCLWGFREKEELLDSGADLIAEKPEYVIRFMEKIEKTS